MEDYSDRDWGVIYQQGWSLYLKEKTDKDRYNSSFQNKTRIKSVGNLMGPNVILVTVVIFSIGTCSCHVLT